MYQPPLFREDRLDILHALIRAHPFAILVGVEDGAPAANHLPMILHPDEGEFGTLRGHVARANPLWRSYDPAAGVLAIFQGPHHYVTPSWYPSKAEHGKVVPTWNYAVVHAAGAMRTYDDPQRLRTHLTALVGQQEGERHEPWALADAPEDFLQKQFKGIVGLEIPIARIEGKWKMSQNRDAADRAGVVDGLNAEGTEAARDVAGTVERQGNSIRSDFS